MIIDTNTVISMTEANQYFSKVSRIIDEYGPAVIFKNNAPRYLVIQFNIADKTEEASLSEALSSAKKGWILIMKLSGNLRVRDQIE